MMTNNNKNVLDRVQESLFVLKTSLSPKEELIAACCAARRGTTDEEVRLSLSAVLVEVNKANWPLVRGMLESLEQTLSLSA